MVPNRATHHILNLQYYVRYTRPVELHRSVYGKGVKALEAKISEFFWKTMYQEFLREFLR